MNAFRRSIERQETEQQETERQGTEQAEADLRSLFENAPMGMAQCTHEGTITVMNPALEQMLAGRLPTGRSPSFGDLMLQEDSSESARWFHETISGSRRSFHLENRIVGADRNAVWVRWTVWRVSSRAGQLGYALIMADDKTESGRTEERLRQAEKLEAVGRLAAGVAHDFNNLLTGVMLYCDLLLAELESGNRLRKYAQEIQAAGMQATGLIRQLLALARPQNVQARVISLNEIAEGMRNLLVRLIGENIELHFHFDPGLGLIKMDPAQAQQILLNLVLNARDALPDGGQITIQTNNCRMQILADGVSEDSRTTLSCVLFMVSDDGRGMDAETRQHLFDAFFTTKAGKGTGLGLSTVRSIVTSSGGLIHVDSAPESGTRVTVLLPLVSDGEARPPDIDDLQQEATPKPEKELI